MRIARAHRACLVGIAVLAACGGYARHPSTGVGVGDVAEEVGVSREAIEENSDPETGRVTVCHRPRGHAGDTHTLHVPLEALRARLQEVGDTLGACGSSDGGAIGDGGGVANDGGPIGDGGVAVDGGPIGDGGGVAIDGGPIGDGGGVANDGGAIADGGIPGAGDGGAASDGGVPGAGDGGAASDGGIPGAGDGGAASDGGVPGAGDGGAASDGGVPGAGDGGAANDAGPFVERHREPSPGRFAHGRAAPRAPVAVAWAGGTSRAAP